MRFEKDYRHSSDCCLFVGGRCENARKTKPPKILVTGGSGKLGKALKSALLSASPDRNGHITYHQMTSEDVNSSSFAAIVRDFRPDFIINCAAYTDVAACEDNPEKAFKVNHLGARKVAQLAASYYASMIHISTDYVFDGARPPEHKYLENSRTNPLNIYGMSKLAGERAVFNEFIGREWLNSVVVRTSGLYSLADGSNFINRIWNADHAAVNSQRCTPTSVEDLAASLLKLIELMGLRRKDNSNSFFNKIINLTNTSNPNKGPDRVEVAMLIGKFSGTSVTRVTDGTNGVKRPAMSTLNNKKAADLGIQLPEWSKSLRAYCLNKHQTQERTRMMAHLVVPKMPFFDRSGPFHW